MKAPWQTTLRRFGLTSFALAFVIVLTALTAMAQEDANIVSREVPEQTITFDTANPYTKAPGKMTIVFSGVFHFTTETEDTQAGMTRVTGAQAGTFTFVPEDSSQTPVQGNFRFRLSGRMQKGRDVVDFAFTMTGVAQDGLKFTFLQSQRAVLKEDGIEISFGETRALDARGN